MEGVNSAEMPTKPFLLPQAIKEPRGTLGGSVHAGDSSAIREQIDSILIILPSSAWQAQCDVHMLYCSRQQGANVSFAAALTSVGDVFLAPSSMLPTHTYIFLKHSTYSGSAEGVRAVSSSHGTAFSFKLCFLP